MKTRSRFTGMMKSLISSARYTIDVSGGNEANMDSLRPVGIVLWGIAYGVILSLCFAGSWKLFGEIYFSEYSRLRLIPISIILLLSGIFGFRQLLGLAVTVDRLVMGDGAAPPLNEQEKKIPAVHFPGQLAVLLLFLVKFAALLAMPYQTPWWPGDWRRYFNFLYPKVLYRVLILFGLWGKTAILIAAATGPTSEKAAPVDRAFRKKMNIRSLIGNLLITFVLTSVYFSSWKNHAMGILVAFILFLLVYLCSMFLAWRLKGHDRFSIFATAELAETLVLLSYLIISRYM
jgi:hypothetical protein